MKLVLLRGVSEILSGRSLVCLLSFVFYVLPFP